VRFCIALSKTWFRCFFCLFRSPKMWQAWPEVLSLATITSLQRALALLNRTRSAAQNNELTLLFAPFPVKLRLDKEERSKNQPWKARKFIKLVDFWKLATFRITWLDPQVRNRSA
jgi:hypothetical protein